MDKFGWPVRIYHEDTDSGGVVYYANYLRYMERARTEWLRSHGFEQDALRDDHNLQFVVVHASLDYLQPSKFNDLLTVQVDPIQTGRVSITLAQPVYRGEQTLLCRGEVRIACVDCSTLRPTAMPVNMIERLQLA